MSAEEEVRATRKKRPFSCESWSWRLVFRDIQVHARTCP